MKLLIKLFKYLGLFFAVFLLIVACNVNNSGNQTQSPTQTNQNGGNSGSRISVGTTLNARTIDPADSYEIAGLNVIYNVCESLYTYEIGTTKIKPLLATAMPTIKEKGLVYIIPLRQGVTFHDGTPFNAKAMKFSLERFIKNAGKPSFLLGDTIEEMEATGEYELSIKLSKPFAAFPSLLAFPGACAVSPKAYKIGQGEFLPNELIATGPYKLREFGSDSIILDIFDNYWGEKPKNQGINIQVYAGNPANLFNSFRTGAIDVAYQSFAPIQINTLLALAKEGKWQNIEGKGTVVSYLVLNRNQEPLNKVEVRQAIAALIDRKLLVDRILQGQGEPVYSLIPSVFDVYKPTFQTAYGDANITLAKELLTKAGYSASKPAIVEIWYPSASKTRSDVATLLKAFAQKELGGMIRFEPNSVESTTAFSNLGKGVYASFLADWYPDFLDPDNYIQPFLDCVKGSKSTGCEEGGAQNQGSFLYNPLLNQLIDQQRKDPNSATRLKIFEEIQKIMAEEVPYIPLWQEKDYVFAQNGVTGLTINPSQYLSLWTIKK